MVAWPTPSMWAQSGNLPRSTSSWNGFASSGYITQSLLLMMSVLLRVKVLPGHSVMLALYGDAHHDLQSLCRFHPRGLGNEVRTGSRFLTLWPFVSRRTLKPELLEVTLAD